MSSTLHIRYIPHNLNTKYYSVKLYRNGNSVAFVCRKYKISKSSLMRWNKKFDGSKDSLIDKSHKPITVHPNSHTQTEIKWIEDLLRRNPKISMIELYGKLRVNKGYSRHAASLFRVLRKLGHFEKQQKKKSKYIPKPYNTPKQIGEKWQLDVKFVPKRCYVGQLPDKFYQYTVID